MKNKMLILGGGYIGARLQEEFGCPLSKKKLYTFKDAEKEIMKYSPDILINCIGHIGRNVDDCETDKDKSLMSNAFVPLILAEVALRHNIRLVHISSGCIFHYTYGVSKPITEDKHPDFFDLFYSRTKIYSELPLKSLSERYPILILRIRVPLDDRRYQKNLLTKLLGFKEVIDLPNSITYIPDFVKALRYLIKIKANGIFNVVNKGALRYSELLEAYKKYVPETSYKIVDYKKLKLVRTNLILSSRKLELTGFKVRPIHDVLDECVRGYLNDER